MADTLAKLLIEKGPIAAREFMTKLLAKGKLSSSAQKSRRWYDAIEKNLLWGLE
jgi:hypothetical protein